MADSVEFVQKVKINVIKRSFFSKCVKDVGGWKAAFVCDVELDTELT